MKRRLLVALVSGAAAGATTGIVLDAVGASTHTAVIGGSVVGVAVATTVYAMGSDKTESTQEEVVDTVRVDNSDDILIAEENPGTPQAEDEFIDDGHIEDNSENIPELEDKNEDEIMVEETAKASPEYEGKTEETVDSIAPITDDSNASSSIKEDVPTHQSVIVLKPAQSCDIELNADTIDQYRREQYEENEKEHGCGYWSVCDDHRCPCSSLSALKRGYNPIVWESMSRELHAEIAFGYPQYEYDDDHFHDTDDDEDETEKLG